MKKTLFLFATAAIALASCSSDDTIAENMSLGAADQISFRSFVQNATRAADINTDNLKTTGFTVYATEAGYDYATKPYFPETLFEWDATTTSYKSASPHYWPSTGALDFYAYAPTTANDQITAHTTETNAFTIQPAALSSATTASTQIDLVFANTDNKAKGSSTDEATYYGKNGVVLNFRHAESKVIIKLRNSNNNLKFTVGDVEIGNLYPSGTYTYSDTNTDGQGSGTLTSGWAYGTATQTGTYSMTMSTTTSYNVFDGTVSEANAKTIPNATAADYEMILIPQAVAVQTEYKGNTDDQVGNPFTGTYIAVNLKIQNKTNDAYIVGGADTYQKAIWPLTALTLAPGKSYTFIVDLAGGGYYPTSQDANDDLDPILENAEIKFVSVTVDNWSPQAASTVTFPVPEP